MVILATRADNNSNNNNKGNMAFLLFGRKVIFGPTVTYIYRQRKALKIIDHSSPSAYMHTSK